MTNRYRGEYPSDFQRELRYQLSVSSQTYMTLYVFTDGTYVYDEPGRDHYTLTVLRSISPADLQKSIKQLLLS